MRRLIVLLVISVLVLVPTIKSEAETKRPVQIMFGAVDLPEPQVPEVEPSVVVPQPPPLDPKVIEYLLRTTPPDELIRYEMAEFGPTVVEKFLYLACREGGMGKDREHPKPNPCAPQNRVPAVAFDPSCGADNLHSSASGLFQFLGSWAGWGGYSWVDVVSRDCYTDVMMAKAVYEGLGFKPWS